MRVRPARTADRPAIASLLDELEAMHAQLQPRFFRAPRGARATVREETRDDILLLVEVPSQISDRAAVENALRPSRDRAAKDDEHRSPRLGRAGAVKDDALHAARSDRADSSPARAAKDDALRADRSPAAPDNALRPARQDQLTARAHGANPAAPDNALRPARSSRDAPPRGRDGSSSDPQVCGLCRVRLYDTPRAPLMVPARRAYIEELVVAREHRLKGCGRALVEAAARWAREHGARELLLTVWDGNAEAEQFYAALGYRRVNQALAKEL